MRYSCKYILFFSILFNWECFHGFTGIITPMRLGILSASTMPPSHYVKQPRDVAIDILIESIQKKKDAMDILSVKLESESTSSLDQRDRNTVRHLVSNTIRREGQISKIIKMFLKKLPRDSRVKPIFESCLRLAIYELAFTDNASYGIVSSIVTYFKHHPSPITFAFTKLLNGVLRKISSGRDKLTDTTSPVDNIDNGIFNEWERTWGLTCAENIAKEMMNVPKLDLSLITSSSDSTMNILQGSLLPSGTFRCDNSGEVSQMPGYDEGVWWVQDASSHTAGEVMKNSFPSLNSKEDDSLSNLHCIDMCAAPGGKTAQLLDAGFGKVTAVDISAGRVNILQDNLDRLSLMEDNYEICVADGTKYQPTSHVDGILLDAPCSATGTGRRHPQVLRKKFFPTGNSSSLTTKFRRYDKSDEASLRKLISLQRKLIVNAVNALSSGGVLVYAVCSLFEAEGECQARFMSELTLPYHELKNEEDGTGDGTPKSLLIPYPITSKDVVGFEDAITAEGWLRILPGALQGELKSVDGFFVARFKKR